MQSPYPYGGRGKKNALAEKFSLEDTVIDLSLICQAT